MLRSQQSYLSSSNDEGKDKIIKQQFKVNHSRLDLNSICFRLTESHFYLNYIQNWTMKYDIPESNLLSQNMSKINYPCIPIFHVCWTQFVILISKRHYVMRICKIEKKVIFCVYKIQQKYLLMTMWCDSEHNVCKPLGLFAPKILCRWYNQQLWKLILWIIALICQTIWKH